MALRVGDEAIQAQSQIKVKANLVTESNFPTLTDLEKPLMDDRQIFTQHNYAHTVLQLTRDVKAGEQALCNYEDDNLKKMQQARTKNALLR